MSTMTGEFSPSDKEAWRRGYRRDRKRQSTLVAILSTVGFVGGALAGRHAFAGLEVRA